MNLLDFDKRLEELINNVTVFRDTNKGVQTTGIQDDFMDSSRDLLANLNAAHKAMLAFKAAAKKQNQGLDFCSKKAEPGAELQ